MLTKTEAKKIRRPSRISGSPISITDCTNWRELGESEVHRCGRHVAYDVQSGRILCDEIADYTADTPDGDRVYTCGVHTPSEIKKRRRMPAGGTQ